jgi:hypothetical protein
MAKSRSPLIIVELLEKETVVDMPTITAALGNTSAMTAFRYLQKVAYRRSYNHNGRYYALHTPSRYDCFGLWSFKGIHFSVDGSLRDTTRRLVQESPMGLFHRELQQRLQVRVHNTLIDLWRKAEISREQLDGFFVYLHSDQATQQTQLTRRQEHIAAQLIEDEVTDAMVIEVLLVLVRHPGATSAEVVRRLRGNSPPITAAHVRVVFDRYDLDTVGKKGGPSPS